MLSYRKELLDALSSYTTDTIIYIHTVRGLSERFSKWKLVREEEMIGMTETKDRVNSLDLNISHVQNSHEKCKMLKKYLQSKVAPDLDVDLS